ncbi:ATP-binding cassette domain-containing protein [Kangiella koreensis]|uniref:Probable ATP-binding protein YheS n=1 Tax=Kangiella koreensis (strain DSM 16069 / JCM 12317 / KCTC 12182 / SW-125) TaxID=523791 RepID=C7R5U2_KANKD|nr:ATP-binding cassette domain-containing protein [Kangiella koreensis]ACV27266.1 ABC transporter related [Kangiella koreensis DSM 16069]
MLFFENMALRRGKKVLFEDASFIINPRDKVGVTGANGTGKSSLFGLIRGELEEDAGNFSMAGGITISSVRQETPSVEAPALEYVLQGDEELCAVEAELSRLEERAAQGDHNDADGQRIAKLHQKLDEIDGYSARARAGSLMHGLGFNAEQEQLPVSSFSGGWRMRLNLAQALMCRSNLLLLDEPTNHLDMEAVIWLENWLKAYQGAVLLISHDRDFLDRTINRIAHIEQQKVTLYSGNYSDFELQRAEQLAQQQAQFERQQKEITHMQSFVDRFKAKASKAKQAQSRLKALERMEKIAPAHIDSPFHFEFPELGHLPSPLLQLKSADAGYQVDGGVKKILSGVGFSLMPGDRIGLLGKNGAGKSTLIKVLADELELLAGEKVSAKTLKIGYFAQHQLEQLHPQMSPIQHLQRDYPKATEQELRNFLGGFDFNGDKALEPVAPFSGGEKARLVLAMLVYSKPNLLLLDEPTNHLDLEMRLAMTMAFQSFEGAMVLVSHDRHMLRTVCDDLYLVAGGKVEPFKGDLDDYARWSLEDTLQQKKASQGKTDSVSAEEESSPAKSNDVENELSRKEQRQLEAEKRKQLQPLKNKLKKLEQQLEDLNQRKAKLDEVMADPTLYEESNKDKLTQLTGDYSAVKSQLEQTEEEWLELQDQLEQLV